jgi:hypothetical protein
VPELATLEAHPRVSMRVHMTKVPKSQAEKLGDQCDLGRVPIPGVEAVKPAPTVEVVNAALPPYTVPGRPDMHSTIRQVASECGTNQCILVAACGPSGLSDDVRDAVRDCISSDGPDIDLRLEAFGW